MRGWSSSTRSLCVRERENDKVKKRVTKKDQKKIKGTTKPLMANLNITSREEQRKASILTAGGKYYIQCPVY